MKVDTFAANTRRFDKWFVVLVCEATNDKRRRMRLVISLWVRSEALNIDSAFQKIKGLCLEISKISWPPMAIVEHHNVGLKAKTWPSRLIMEYMLNTQAKARQSEI